MTYSRRKFLKVTAAAAAGATLFDVEELLAAPPWTRPDVGGLTAKSPVLVSYAKAIKAMQALPSTNPLSWAYQAAIHGTTLPGSFPAWNTCQHGTHYFWSWHRMYLYWFERIIRKMSGDPNFALPFWNYELSTERQLPAPFRNSGSALFTSNRGAGWNTGAASLLSSAVAISGFMPTVPYYNAQSGCESTPHGAVHVSIGGWMGSVPTAAQDPIFYLHHANIDRLWNLWLKQGGGRTDPLTDAAWKTTKFLFFDENGNQKWMTGCDVLRAVKDPDTDVTLELEGVEADRQPNVYWEVYAGLPKGTTPNSESAHYVGNVALFGHGIHDEHQHDGFQPAEFSFRLDRALSALTAEESGRVSIAFVARGAVLKGETAGPRSEATVSVGKASLATRRLKRT
jgi:tyrosinase-like protein